MGSSCRPQRLRKSPEVQRVLREGSRWNGRVLRVLWVGNQLGVDRFAVVVSRRLGTAVVRNRMKRLMREAIRKSVNGPGRCDVVCLARSAEPMGLAAVVADVAEWEKLRGSWPRES